MNVCECESACVHKCLGGIGVGSICHDISLTKPQTLQATVDFYEKILSETVTALGVSFPCAKRRRPQYLGLGSSEPPPLFTGV